MSENSTTDAEITPSGTYHGHEGVHQFLDFFVPDLPAGDLRARRDGKIVQIKVAFDQMPLAQASAVKHLITTEAADNVGGAGPKKRVSTLSAVMPSPLCFRVRQ